MKVEVTILSLYRDFFSTKTLSYKYIDFSRYVLL